MFRRKTLADSSNNEKAGPQPLQKASAGNGKFMAASLATLAAGGFLAACGTTSSSSNANPIRPGTRSPGSGPGSGPGPEMMSPGPVGPARQYPTTTEGAGTAPSTQSASSSGEAQSGAAAVVPIVLQRDDNSGTAGTITGKPDWPRFAPSVVNLSAGKRVTLLIINYDDMNTPINSMMPYDTVQGGQETVNGVSLTSVGNSKIAHTFTVPSLGVNVPIPMATDSGKGSGATVIPAIVTFTFTPSKSGTFTWQCFTPCGTDPNGMGGPMQTSGYMTGTVNVA